jgi:hypothetical protein
MAWHGMGDCVGTQQKDPHGGKNPTSDVRTRRRLQQCEMAPAGVPRYAKRLLVILLTSS